MKVQCESYFEKLINVSEPHIQNIEVATKAQSLSVTWQEERKRRLTASNFGEVFKKNTSRSVTALATRLMYNSFKGNIHTSRGLAQETTIVLLSKNTCNIQTTILAILKYPKWA